MRSKALGHHGLDAQQLCALGGPVAAGAGAVFLARKITVGVPCAMYCMAASKMNIFAPLRPLALEGVAALLARAIGSGRDHQVLMRTLAKVPRTITSWLPRRAP